MSKPKKRKGGREGGRKRGREGGRENIGDIIVCIVFVCSLFYSVNIGVCTTQSSCVMSLA